MDSKLVSSLAQEFATHMTAATNGFDRILWVDFPDYENVGDSAIWLGSRMWARDFNKGSAGVLPNRAVSEKSLRRNLDPNTLVVFQGGGNFGGLYADHDRARLEAGRVCQQSRLVQAPQSVHFANPGIERELKDVLSQGGDFRILVRDHASAHAVSGWGEVVLSPDAAHYLGSLTAPQPEFRYVALLRQDKESALSSTAGVDGAITDWKDDKIIGRRVRQLRAEVSRRTNSDIWIRGIDYDRIAQQRLLAGLEVLSRGEVVITDRLHAMILGVQLGRRVVAIDNKIGKLSKYARTWLTGIGPEELTFCDTLQEALVVAGHEE